MCVYIGYIRIVLKVLGSASYCSVLGVGEGHSWSGKSCSSVCLYGDIIDLHRLPGGKRSNRGCVK